MTEIVQSMFGLTPMQIQQQRQQENNAAAADFARMNATQRGVMGLYQGGAGVGGMLGLRDPQMEQAQANQQLMGQLDPNDPDSYLKLAQQTQDPRLKLGLVQKASEIKKQIALEQAAAQKLALEQRKQDFTEQEAFDLKKQALAQQLEIAKQRSEDTRLSIEQRAEAARLAAETRKEIASLVAAVKQSGGSGSPTKPKNLTREAGLKWELSNGMIDQETYDSAMSATPGGKAVEAKVAAAKSAISGFDAVERNISKLYDPATKSLSASAKPLFGKYAQYRPDLLQSQETVDANTALESLTNQVMMTNLADAKERVGQSFGSMQVQEWDKFTQQLTSLKRGLSEKSAAEAMQYVSNFIRTKKEVLKAALGTPNTVNSEVPAVPLSTGAAPAPVAAAPADFDAKWAALKPGQTLVGPNGKTYTKKQSWPGHPHPTR